MDHFKSNGTVFVYLTTLELHRMKFFLRVPFNIRRSIPGGGGGQIFRTCPDLPWGPPSLQYNGYRVFPGDKAAVGVALATHPHLALMLKKE